MSGRWPTLVLVASAAALVGSLYVAVRRDASARATISATDSLRAEMQAARERLNRQTRRADSLGSRERILRAAGRLGFRAPADTEVR
ncbi:MAG: hypothetical protein ABEJ46_06315, partial [Gemmatimonadota bacterium]